MSPRHGAVGVWTGQEVVVVGGSTTPPCPGTALCAIGLERKDGAAYDPAAGSWRPIAAAPEPVTATSAVALGGDVYLLEREPGGGPRDRMLRYDPEGDAWIDLPAPTHPEGRRLLAWEDRLVAVVESAPTPPTSVHEVWDPATAGWAPLAADPMPPEHYRFGFTVRSDLYVSTIDALARHDGSGWEAVDVGADGPTCDDLTAAAAGTGDPQAVLMPRGPDSPAFCVRGDDGALAGVDPPPSYDAATRIIEFPLGGEEHVALGTSVYDIEAARWSSLDAPQTLRREGMAAVWADGTLITFGGNARTDASDAPVYGDAWLWTAPGQR